MSLKGTTLSKEGLEYLCGLINKIVSSPKDLLDDINLATNTTFSSVRIDSLIADTLQQSNTHAEALCNALTKLTCEKTTTQPTLSNSEKNVIYLYSSDGNAPFHQYLKISDTELIDMGSTSISLNDYLTITDAVATYCKKTDFDALKTEVDKVKTTLGTDTLNTTSQDLTGGVNELKTDLTTHTNDTDIHITTAERTKWDKVDNKIDKTDITTTIDSSSTDSQVPSAKAIYNKSKNMSPRLPDGTDVIEYAETFGRELVTETFRIMNATNSPYGVNNNANDFHYTIYNMGDSNYKRVIAYDIRKNCMYMIMKYYGTWGTWQRVCTTSVADVAPTTTTFTDTKNYKPSPIVGFKYTVSNGICYVTGGINCVSPSSNNVEVYTLPKPKLGSLCYKTFSFSSNDTNTTFIVIGAGGKLNLSKGVANVEYRCSFTYPVAEQ